MSTAPVKVAIDDHIQRLFEALQTCLKRSIQEDLTAAETFVSSCMEALSQRPQTVDELSKTAEKHEEFTNTKKAVIIIIDYSFVVTVDFNSSIF